MKTSPFMVGLLWVAFAANAGDPRSMATPGAEADLQRAQAAMADFGRSLRGALQQKLAAEGAVAAVAFCANEAPRIAAEVSARHGVTVGRSSLKHRSTANAPTDWQRAVLAEFAAKAVGGEAPESLTYRSDDGRTLRIAKGLRVEAACLLCHGPKTGIAPAVAAAIASAYPQDQATGFSEGDLRGMIWAELDLARAKQDARQSVPMTDAQMQALRAEMRRHLESVQRVIAALAASDWNAVASAAADFAPGRGPGHGPGMGMGMGMEHSGRAGVGASFRAALPEGWFVLARPMHAAFNAIAAEAAEGRRVEVVLARLGEATAQCTSCHASFRIDSANDTTAARP